MRARLRKLLVWLFGAAGALAGYGVTRIIEPDAVFVFPIIFLGAIIFTPLGSFVSARLLGPEPAPARPPPPRGRGSARRAR